MAVAINNPVLQDNTPRPKEKKDSDLDIMIKALGMARDAFGIYANIDQLTSHAVYREKAQSDMNISQNKSALEQHIFDESKRVNTSKIGETEANAQKMNEHVRASQADQKRLDQQQPLKDNETNAKIDLIREQIRASQNPKPEKITPEQQAASARGEAMQHSLDVFDELTKKYNPVTKKKEKTGFDPAARTTAIQEGRFWPSYFTSGDSQRYSGIKETFNLASLNKEKGATSPEELNRVDVIFWPQPNDTDKTMEDKARRRKIETEGMLKRGGGSGSEKPKEMDDPNLDLDLKKIKEMSPAEKKALNKKLDERLKEHGNH